LRVKFPGTWDGRGHRPRANLVGMENTTLNTLGHQHTDRCWWDIEQLGWICTATDPQGRPVPAEEAVVDVRDMLVVHTALLREFRIIPAAIGRVAAGDRRRAAVVDRHLGLLCDLLHHHHEGEDDLLWPPLRRRVPAAAVALLEDAEAQHAALDAALAEVAAARRGWRENLDDTSRDHLADTVRTLHALLAAHLDDEERTLLPLAASYLTEAEWKAVGAAGAAAVPKHLLPLVFGMFAYEGDPAVLATMLADAPAVPRAVVPLVAPRVYARRAALVHGTSRP
jgi:hemerythrin-like domain-containing protein